MCLAEHKIDSERCEVRNEGPVGAEKQPLRVSLGSLHARIVEAG